jgi:superfamily II DNA or RNA helicase
MNKHIQIAANAVNARIIDPTEDMKMAISELLSYQVTGAEHTASFKSGTWTGRSTLFSYSKAMFPAGLLTIVISHLTQQGYKVQLIRKPAPEPLGEEEISVDEHGYTEEYKYQYDTVNSLVKHRAIVAQVATGGGKSRIGAMAYAKIKRPTLFITTRSVLMYQMKKSFDKSIAFRKSSGEKGLDKVFCGVMGDGEWKLSPFLNVAMVQTIQAKLKDPKTEAQMTRILEHFELVILEEAHESSGEGYYNIMNLCKNANYRLALTATPFMREDEEANMRLMAVSGPIGIRVSEKELIDKGILATPQFKIVDVDPPARVKRLSNWQLAYKHGIVESMSRNAIIATEAKQAVQAGLSVMILVQRREHGEILSKLIKDEHTKVKYIFGDSSQLDRDKALTDLANGDINVLIGSTIMDVGVDVPAVGMVILAGAGKAEVALRQRIGRGLRRKKPPQKNRAYILEFRDKVNKHLIGHSEQRRQILENTPGFVENILPRGVDFDFKEKHNGCK